MKNLFTILIGLFLTVFYCAAEERVVIFDVPEDATVIVRNEAGQELKPDPENNRLYVHTITGYSRYNYEIYAAGYRYCKDTYFIHHASKDVQTIDQLTSVDDATGWDGLTTREPQLVSAEESSEQGGVLEGKEGYYKITNGYGLAWIAQEVNSGNAALNMVLINDIDLCDYPWTPIGYGETRNDNNYEGTFDGHNHEIAGLNIDNSNNYYQALFSTIGAAVIRNLSVRGEVTLAENTNCGAGVVSFVNGEAWIENVHNYVNVSVLGGIAGGMVAVSNTPFTLIRSSNHGEVKASGSVSGGLIGIINSNPNGPENRLDSLVNTGNVTADREVGGIVGDNKYASITNSSNSGTITGTNTTQNTFVSVGGIVGKVESSYGDLKIDRCFNTGEINANRYVGGIVGYAMHTNLSLEMIISNVYNTGKVNASERAGALVGIIPTTVTIENGYVRGENAFLLGDNHMEDNVFNIYTDQQEGMEGAEYKSEAQFASGEVAHLLGEAFSQQLGEDEYPGIGTNNRVYKVTYTTEESAQEEILFSNSTLPYSDGEGNAMIWYTEKGGQEITEINEDCTLYLEIKEAVDATGVNLDKDKLELTKGETYVLVATVMPENATTKRCIWISEDASVASVNSDGLVTALSEGNTTITVTTVDGGFTASCIVTVAKGSGLGDVSISALIYPNPVQDKLNIDNQGVVIEKMIVSDLNGKVVYQNEIQTDTYSVNVNDWTNGIYLMQIISTEGSKTYKVVKK